MLTTSLLPGTTRVIVTDTEIDDDTPQNFIVSVKNASDWEEIHNYIINENEIDNIPNRKIDCTSNMPNSELRSVYNMSVKEAKILETHPKVSWIKQSSLFNPIVLEQRKLDEEQFPHLFTDRFRTNIKNRRDASNTNPGSTLDFTQWGLYRHQSKYNNFGSSTLVSDDCRYSLTGKNVDVVIMDSGCRWDHPEFLKPGVSSFVNKNSTRVRDILLHGAEEYSINWASEGLVAPGSGTLANYTEARVLGSSIPEYHGSHVAGTAAGNQFGAAFEANIWSIACIDRSDVGFSDPNDGWDYIKIWHQNKPINPETGRKNPTIVNGSWGLSQFVSYLNAYNVTVRGTNYTKDTVIAAAGNCPPIYFMQQQAIYHRFTAVETTGQSECEEFANTCPDVTVVVAAGNSKGKLDLPGGLDYSNEFTSGSVVFSGYENYPHRPGTPAATRSGAPDAFIKVGAIDTDRQSGSQEKCASFSERGPAIDVWAAGDIIMSPYAGSGSFADPRDNNFYLIQISGTSMASPNVCGVIATYLESNPSATRADTRKWLLEEGSVVLPATEYYDPYQSNSFSDQNYWGNSHSLKSAPRRILYNPYGNNRRPTISGVILDGVSFQQA